MKIYESPEAVRADSVTEGVYMASGDAEEKVCRFGRNEANPGSDTCQNCSVSGGVRSEKLPGQESPRREDFTVCVDGMPMKE